MAKDAWFDPRLTVFIIWGIFVVLFICIPSKRVVQRIFYMVGCKCCGYDEEEIAQTNNGGCYAYSNGREVQYEILSNARKQEIDSLRASHLTYRLHQFSMTLGEKNMLRRVSQTGETLVTEQHSNTSLPQDRPIEQQQNGSEGDLEMRCVSRTIDPSDNDEGEENKEEEEVDLKYTHISIPLPGHNSEGVDVHDLAARAEIEKKREGSEQKEEKRSTLARLFGGKSSKKEAEESNEDKEDPKAVDDDEEKESRRRSCPIFCAICLMEYEPTERISWSSNPECNHVFHEDCVVRWLVSLGRTKSKMKRFSDEPTEAQLLGYQLECPCCRQEFISRRQAELPDVCVEERA